MKKIRTVGLVAVRMKSSRLKKKALLDLNGKPLILQLFSRLKKSKKMDDIVLCTSTHPDDRVLIELANQNGLKYFAGSEDDVMDRFIRAGERENADVIVRITGDNPLTDPGIIDTMIESHIESGADYTRMDNLPVGVTAEVITFMSLKKAFKMAENSGYSEYMTNYFVNYPDIFSLNILQPDDNLRRPDYRLTVDYQADYDLMKKIFSNFKQFPDASLKDIIAFLDKNPGIARMNSSITPIKLDPSINTRLKTK